MGIKWTADLRVTFELQDGRLDSLAQMIMRREAGQLKHAIERGAGVAPTGVKLGTVRVEIKRQGPQG